MSNETSSVARGAASFLADGRYTDSLASSPRPAGKSPLRDPEHSLQSGATTTNIYSNLVRQRGTTLSRHKCTSANLIKTSALAEDMLSGESTCYRIYPPSSNAIQSSSPSTQLPPYNIIPSNPSHDSTAYFAMAPPPSPSSSSTADDSGYDSASDAGLYTSTCRIARKVTRNESTMDSSAASHISVMKPIRMRTGERRKNLEKAHRQ